MRRRKKWKLDCESWFRRGYGRLSGRDNRSRGLRPSQLARRRRRRCVRLYWDRESRNDFHSKTRRDGEPCLEQDCRKRRQCWDGKKAANRSWEWTRRDRGAGAFSCEKCWREDAWGRREGRWGGKRSQRFGRETGR